MCVPGSDRSESANTWISSYIPSVDDADDEGALFPLPSYEAAAFSSAGVALPEVDIGAVEWLLLLSPSTPSPLKMPFSFSTYCVELSVKAMIELGSSSRTMI